MSKKVLKNMGFRGYSSSKESPPVLNASETAVSDSIVLRIAMVDVDLLNNGTRHPNLAQMKMSSFCKMQGHDVRLIFNPDELNDLSSFDFVLVSKVFNYTPVPSQIQQLIKDSTNELDPIEVRLAALNEPSIKDSINYYAKELRRKPLKTLILIGGTGFFEDGGRDLDYEIEHIMPDYDLYSDFVEIASQKRRDKSYYSDYIGCSIGFLTRGCFRKCSFCVNKKYDRPFINTEDVWSFHKEGNKVIYLWDDNFLSIGRKKSLELLDKLIQVDVPFQFRQGLDLRLMNDEVAAKFQQCKYHGDFIFAFDHIQDKDTIIDKLGIWRKHCVKETKLYVLCAYDARSDDPKYGIKGDLPVEKKDLIDIENTFERIRILMGFQCLPYIMRYISYKESPYRGIYTQLARWCNQPSIFKRMSFEEFCIRNQEYAKSDRICAPLRALNLLKSDAPDVYEKYARIKYLYKGLDHNPEVIE